MISRTPLAEGWTVTAAPLTTDGPAARLPAHIPANVPGTIHTDLLTAGLIPDPYLDENELDLQWIGHTPWIYTTVIEWAPSATARTDLVFDGLDTIAVIRLNGEEIGRTFNQHRSYRFDISSHLREGSNELEVRFESAWEYARQLEALLGSRPNAYPTPFNFVRKMAANFGWDWGPQLVTAGIWKGVRLESWSTARLAEVSVTANVTDSFDGRLRVRATAEAIRADALSVEVEVAGVSASALVVDGEATIDLQVAGVDVWWPRGMGEQPLYDLSVRLMSSGAVLDSTSKRVGFKSVVLDTSEDEAGSAFTFVINGLPVFIRGANWIPDDCFPSRITKARYRERIEQAVDANLNLLRVWGGGIYERDEFYDICDELGVLTWQDFLFACAAYPEESPLQEEVEAEARENVVRISSHASLVLWNGCNENIWGWFDWDWQADLGSLSWGLGFYTKLLPAIVADFAPNIPYWAASPYSGSMDVHANEFSRGNVHIWDIWNQVDYKTYAAYRPRFVSEFGFQGPPTMATITRSIHDAPLAPDSPGMLLHQKAGDGNGKLERGMAPHLPVPTTMEEWHYLTQLNQSRAVVFAVERYRSQRPHCMGTIVWQLNDCWPVTSWAAIDGDGRRKPLWHGLKRSNSPRLLTIQEDEDGLALFAINDDIHEWTFVAKAERMRFDGTVSERHTVAIKVAPLSQEKARLPSELWVTPDSREELVVAHVSDHRPVVWTFEEDKDLDLPVAEIDTEFGAWSDGKQSITLSASSFVRGVSVFPDLLHPEAWADDSDIDLIPGTTVTVVISTPVPLGGDDLSSAPVLRNLNALITGAREHRLQVESVRH